MAAFEFGIFHIESHCLTTVWLGSRIFYKSFTDFCYFHSSVDWHRTITRSRDPNLLKILYRTLILYLYLQSDGSHDPNSIVEQYHEMYIKMEYT